MTNFTFLKTHWADLEKLGDLAEKYVYSDPNGSIFKQGMCAEKMVRYMLAYDGIEEPSDDNTHAKRIRILKGYGLLPREIDNTLYHALYLAERPQCGVAQCNGRAEEGIVQSEAVL